MSRIKSIRIGGKKPVGSLTLITLALIFLRAFEVIQCSWWWVFAPMWGPVAIFIIGVLGILAVGTCVEVWNHFAYKRRRNRNVKTAKKWIKDKEDMFSST